MAQHLLKKMAGLLIAVIIALPFIPSQTVVNPEPKKVEVAEDILKFSNKEDIIRSVEILAPQYGQDPTTVLEIIRCESSFNPKARNIQAKVGVDIGLMQINTYYHLETMNKLGLDIEDPEDNLRYGLILMREQGTQPWFWSHFCHGK